MLFVPLPNWSLGAAAGCMLAFGVLSCSGGSKESPLPAAVPGSGSSMGTVGGTSLQVADAFANVYQAPLNSSGVYDSSYEVILTSYAGGCGLYQQDNSHKPNGITVELRVLLEDSSASPSLNSGAYSFGPLGQSATDSTTLREVGGEFRRYSSDCTEEVTPASGGDLKFQGTGDPLSGSFSLTFGADTISGTFNAPACAHNPNAGSAVPQCAP